MTDIVERLYTACNGHPYAKISWPHRLLHDAASEIQRLRGALMTRTPLNSTLVQAISHDPETRTCHVELIHKGTYAYHDVPPEHVDALIKSESAGAHFNSVFKAAHGHKARKIG